MKVLLVGNYALDGQISLIGFAGALQKGLAGEGSVEIRAIAPRPVLNALPGVPKKMRKWVGYVDKLAMFPPELRKAAAWADLVHICEQGNAIYLKHLRGKRHLVTCHDLLGYRSARGDFDFWQTKGSGVQLQKMILDGLALAQNVANISGATQQDFEQIVGRPTGQFPVIYNGLFQDYHRMPAEQARPLLERAGIPTDGTPYLLHVGKNAPTKNRRGVLLIFDALRKLPGYENMRLVMVGLPFTAEMRRIVAERGLDQNDLVRERVMIELEQVRALYSSATALLFPSLGEGFGMPIIEAQACGCPVFTSNRAPMNEIGGDAAVYIDPTQPEAAARVIAEHLARPGERERMAMGGLKNVADRFTTERMVREYLALYRQICERPQAAGVGSVGAKAATSSGAVS